MNDHSSTGGSPVAIVTLVDRPHLVDAVTTLDAFNTTVRSTSWAVASDMQGRSPWRLVVVADLLVKQNTRTERAAYNLLAAVLEEHRWNSTGKRLPSKM